MRPTLLTLLLLATGTATRADDTWSLTTADFKRQVVTLRSIDDTGPTVLFPNAGDKPTHLAWDHFLQFDRGGGAAAAIRGTFTLYLVSGDRVGGEPVSIANDSVTWRSPAAGDLSIPLKDLRGIARGADAPQFDPARTEDVVFLNNGDNVKGIITGLEGGKVAVKQAGGDVLPVDLASAKAIHFAAAAADNPVGRAFRIQLSDGSVVTAPKLRLPAGDHQLMLSLGTGADRPVDIQQVVVIEQLNGPVSWLSARVPAEILYQPMFETNFPPQMDRNYARERIKFAGHEYARGIGVHAYARLTYNLDGQGFKVFRTQYAMNEGATKGRVTVRILLDGKVVHEAKDFPPGKLSPVILLDLGNAKTLTLEAHPGGDAASDDRIKWNADTQARLNWIEPALLREKPAPEEPKAEVKPEPSPERKPDPPTDAPK